jgi:hypothetical protein
MESPPGSGFSVNGISFTNTEYSVEWTGYIYLTSGTTYYFQLSSDDGSLLYINTAPGSSTISGSNLVLNDADTDGTGLGIGIQSYTPDGTQNSGAVTVAESGWYPIEIDYYQTCDSQSGIDLSWATGSPSSFTIIPTTSFEPAQLGSNSNVEMLVVNPATTSVSTLSSSVETVTPGTLVTDSATVSTGVYNAGTPSGSVQFYFCGPTATATPCSISSETQFGAPVVLSGGSATSPEAEGPTTVGYYCWSAVYTPDNSNFVGSQSTTTTNECFQVVAPTTVTTTSSYTGVVMPGTLVTDSATVAAVPSGAGTPSGELQFYFCGPTATATPCSVSSETQFGAPVTLSGGSATSPESEGPTAVGYYCWSAVYTPDNTNFISSQSTTTTNECFQILPPSLTLVKTVTNSYGGTAVPTDWTLSATGTGTPISGTTPVTSGPDFLAGTYTLSESGGPSGYASGSWSCTNSIEVGEGSTITLTNGQSTTCTVNNYDIQPQLTVIKDVNNNNGGTAVPSDFGMNVIGTDVTNPSFAGSNTGVTVGLNAGSYSVTETSLFGYNNVETSPGCSGTIGIGQTATCTFVNNDIAPSLQLIKTVTNDNGGTAVPADWTLTAQGTGSNSISGAGGVTSGPTFQADTYTLSESSGPFGYAAGQWSCTGVENDGDSITMGIGQSAVCTINNNDIPPSLTLIKTVTNSYGGTAVPADWTLTATYGTNTLTGTNGITSGPTFQAGTYTLSESDGPSGYAAGTWSCYQTDEPDAVSDMATIGIGQTWICEINNHDIQPLLTVTKVVENNYGGTLTSEDFPLFVGANSVTIDVQNGFNAGTYTVSETQQPGYTGDVITGDCAANGAITLNVGDVKSCTITNYDIPANLIIVKNTVGGDGTFNFITTGEDLSPFSISTTSGSGYRAFNSISAGSYSVTEETPKGWVQTSNTCSGEQSPSDISLGLGQTVTCTFVDTQNATINIVKNTITTNAISSAGTFNYTLDSTPFTVITSGNIGETSFTENVLPGEHSITENVPNGWTLTNSICSNGQAANALDLSAGQSVTCTFTDTQNALIIVTKTVNNCAPCTGGVATSNDFTMNVVYAGGLGYDSFPGNSLGTTVSITPGLYTVGETGLSGYLAEYQGACFGYAQSGQSYTCNVINNAVPPQMTVIKKVVGGSALPSQFTLNITNGAHPSPFAGNASGTVVELKPGAFNVSELPGGPAGYVASYSEGPGVNCTGTVTLGQNEICTVTNNFQYSKITVIKNVLNNYTYGTLTPNAFVINVISNGNVIASFNGSSTGTTVSLPSGPFQVVETNTQGYVAKFVGTCYGTTTFGQNIICTINNCDQPSFLTVIDNVFGGNAIPSQFIMNITNSANPSPFPGSSSGTLVPIAPGNYAVSELLGSPVGYSASYSAGCTGSMTMGQSSTCVVNNYDTANALVVTKMVNNKYGGTATPSSFTMSIYSNNALWTTIPGSSLGTLVPIPVGTYHVTESSLTGYSQVSSAGCSGTVSYGQAIVCTVINNDTKPVLTITPSNVILDSGEYETYTLTVTGGAGPFNVELYNITGSKQVGASVVIPTAGGSNTVTFQSHAVGTFTYNGMATQGTYAFASASNTIVVNPALIPPVITVGGGKYDRGESVTLTSSTPGGGTPPYTYTFVVTNSNTMQTFYVCTDINNNFCVFSATQLGPYFANVIVTDSAFPTPESVNSINPANFVVNPDFNLIGNHFPTISVNTLTLSPGGSVLITANAVGNGGSAPYTYTFSVYNAITNQQIGANIVTTNNSLSNSIAYMPLSNGLYYATVIVMDSGTPNELMQSGHSLAFLQGTVSSPTVLLTPSKPAYDSGQNIFYVAQVIGGIGPFNIELYNVTGSAQQIGTSNIVTSATANFIFPANSPISTQQFTFNALVYDEGASAGFNSISNTITVNPPLGSLVTVVPKIIDVGQSAVLTATIAGGTSPYNFTFNVLSGNNPPFFVNTVLDVSATNPSNTVVPTSVSITFNSAPYGAGIDTVNVSITDGAGGSETLKTNTLTVNALPVIIVTPTPSSLIAGNWTVLTNTTTSGTPPYTTYSYTVSPGTQPVNYTISGNSILFETNGTYAVTETVTDSLGGIGSNTVNVVVTGNSVIVTPPSTTSTTTIPQNNGGGGGGGGGSTGGGGGVGGGGTFKPTVLEYNNTNQTGWTIINLTDYETQIVVINNKTFTVVVHFVTPTSAGVTINGHNYTLQLGNITKLNDPLGYTYYANITSITYMPILYEDVMTLVIWGQPNGPFNTTAPATTTVQTTVPTTVSTTVPATTVPPTTTTVPQKTSGIPLGPLIGTGIAIATAIAVGVAYSRNRNRGRRR